MIEYIEQNYWLLWTILAVICLIIELGSGDFFVTCFAIGAFGALVVSLVDMPLWAQVIVFAAVSVLSILFIRPPLVRLLHATGPNRLSNAEALIGRQGTVVDKISPNHHGYVKIDGDVWKAVTKADEEIEEGEKVRVISMESIIVTVERCL